MLNAERLHLLAHVFTTLVIMQCADFVTSLGLSQSLELLESSKSVRLGLQKGDCLLLMSAYLRQKTRLSCKQYLISVQLAL